MWMAKIKIFLLFVIVVTLTITVAAADDHPDEVVPGPAPFLASENESNLLINPSFEGGYEPYDPPIPHPDCNFVICQTANMADGWTPWWIKSRPTDVNPEYKPAELWHKDPDRVLSGSRAQQYFSFSTTHEAGIYQQVPVQNGTDYFFSIWGHSWSAHDDDDAYSGPEDGWLDQKIGIDPTGGTDPQSLNVFWGPPRLQYDEYGYFSLEATAESDVLTVFTYSKPKYPVKHNDVYWDEACLTSLPVAGELNITPSAGLTFLSKASEPTVMTQTLTIILPEDSCGNWNAKVESSGTFTPTIFLDQKKPSDQLLVSVDSSGHLPGIHSAAIKIEANLSMVGSPVNVPVKLTVINDKVFQFTYIPAVFNK
jgi:hypothetical protein